MPQMLHLGRAEYLVFLKTDFWLELSQEKKRSVGNRCELCFSPDDLQCHHKFYRRSWFETKLSDLVVCCAGCHQKIHYSLAIPPTRKPVRIKYKKQQKKRIKFQNYSHGFNRTPCSVNIRY